MGRGLASMVDNQYVKHQLHLLFYAVSNVVDNNPNVEHITMKEIRDWIEDILEDGWIK